MVRIQVLHRQNAGTLALVVLQDTRWEDERRIIGTMEVDMSSGTQLVYLAPKIMTSIYDFKDHIKLSVQTRGYEGWRGESNLLLSKGLVGRLTNSSSTGFRYNVKYLKEFLATEGIRAILGVLRTAEVHRGEPWELKPVIHKSPKAIQMNPRNVISRSRSDGRVFLNFKDYQKIEARPSLSLPQKEEEEAYDELALLWYENDPFKTSSSLLEI